MRRWNVVPLILILLTAAGCALTPAGYTSAPPPDSTTLTISPATANVRAGSSQTFVPSITSVPLTWSVNGVAGGSSSVGTITSAGVYTAPATLPSPNNITVSVAETSKTSITGSSAVTLLNPIPQISGVSPSQLQVGTFTLTITGSGFVTGATATFGATSLSITSVSANQIVATGVASTTEIGTSVAVVVDNPNPGATASNSSSAQVLGNSTPQIPANVASRFLQQTTFGPTEALIAQVQSVGLQGFLTSQFGLPVTPYPQPASSETGTGAVQQRFYMMNIGAQDQLRQRVAFALSQIFVVGSDKIGDPNGETQWVQLLEKDAFTNYRQVMYDVTTSPAMGDWLDMVNNGKPQTGEDHANENFARENMQLFTIGTSMLNPDGSMQLDGSGNPIPTYSQAQVQEFALAYTGWTYPVTPGNTAHTYNPQYWIGPMVAVDSNHDMTAKQLLTYPGVANGGLLPAGQGAVADLNGALDNIFNHPNIGPFVCRELIQHLVTSNPSPAYIQRVAAVFDNNGQSVRGDMKSVITAILMDPEARRGDDSSTAVATDGHLQEPILYMVGLLRAFGATTSASSLGYQGSTMGQNALDSPSVFNFYSPNYVIPQSTSYGPEFQILTTSTALYRVNWTNSLVFNQISSDTTVDYSSWAAQASNPSALVDSLNTLMLHGTMSADMKTSILTAMQAVPAGSNQQLQEAETAIYLIATSSQYQIQR
ncbi:MAG: DUF1800 family protein [Candidatus Acidiferrales bacterium]